MKRTIAVLWTQDGMYECRDYIITINVEKKSRPLFHIYAFI